MIRHVSAISFFLVFLDHGIFLIHVPMHMSRHGLHVLPCDCWRWGDQWIAGRVQAMLGES